MKKLYDGMVLSMVALVATTLRDVVVFEDSVGIAQTSGEIGDTISVDTVGVYEFPTVDAEAIAVGTVLYWDATLKVATIDDDAGANVRIGTSWDAKGAGTVGTVGVKIG